MNTLIFYLLLCSTPDGNNTYKDEFNDYDLARLKQDKLEIPEYDYRCTITEETN